MCVCVCVCVRARALVCTWFAEILWSVSPRSDWSSTAVHGEQCRRGRCGGGDGGGEQRLLLVVVGVMMVDV